MRIPRTLLATLLATLLGGTVVLAASSPAQAAEVYRYWTYFTVTDGEFVVQNTGPAGATPADGAIEAYRFAAPADFNKPNLPRADLDDLTFDAVCGDTAATTGKKRVAVLIDYGVDADSEGQDIPDPEAACALVAEDANGMQVLEAAAGDIRTQQSSAGPLLCGISGYPATGCADVVVAEGTPADGAAVDFAIAGEPDEAADDEDDSNTVLLVGIAAILGLLVAAGVFLNKRNKSA